MARASVRTLLPLDRFARIIGYHPLHFNQVYVDTNDLAPVVTCANPMLQYPWQNSDSTGREDIAQAIAEAEMQLATWLGFNVAPTWEVDEVVQAIRLPAGMWAPLIVRARFKYLISGGREAFTLIDAARPVTYSDGDGDGYAETATVTVTTTVTEADEIALYYPGHGGDYAWEIRPITVTISGGTATITCRREQLVTEDLQEAINATGVDGSVDGNFLTTVAVYRHYHDPSLQMQMLWQGGSCCTTTCTQCEGSMSTGCLSIRDPQAGIFHGAAATWDADEEEFTTVGVSCPPTGAPTRMRIWYRAGWRNQRLTLPNVQMDPMWERAVAYLALTYLDRPLCGCRPIRDLVQYWAKDLALVSSEQGSSESFRIPNQVFNNPFGTSRAAVYAWRIVQRERLGDAVYA